MGRQKERLAIPGLYHAAGIALVRIVVVCGIGAVVTVIASMGFVVSDEELTRLWWIIPVAGLPISFLASLAILQLMVRIDYRTALRIQLLEIVVAVILSAGIALVAGALILLARWIE